MIDFDECTIHSLCHPARYSKSTLASRLEEALLEVAETRALRADKLIQEKKYEEAVDILEWMISRLEELETDIKSDSKAVYQLTYSEVENTSYHSRVVRAADEYDNNKCTLGALKSAKEDLESSSV